MNKGYISSINGSVIQAKFDELPKIHNKLTAKNIVIEVLELLDNNEIKGVALNSVSGLSLNDEVVDTGETIKVPVGDELLGRMLNVFGEPIDNKGDITVSGEIEKREGNKVFLKSIDEDNKNQLEQIKGKSYNEIKTNYEQMGATCK